MCTEDLQYQAGQSCTGKAACAAAEKIAQQEVAKPLPCTVTALGAAEASPRPLHTPPTVTPVCTHVHLYERQQSLIIYIYIYIYMYTHVYVDISCASGTLHALNSLTLGLY